MSTTTIRMPEDLKARVAKAAKRAGKTSHALILEAIADHVTDEERRNEFYDVAEERFARIAESGHTIPWDNMKMYLTNRLAGRSPARPRSRKLAR